MDSKTTLYLIVKNPDFFGFPDYFEKYGELIILSFEISKNNTNQIYFLSDSRTSLEAED